MTVHLLRPAAGCPDLDTLRHRQAGMGGTYRGRRCPAAFTRTIPKRRSEILDGGSVYWIVRHSIQARNPIAGIETEHSGDGRPYALIYLEPVIIPVKPTARRAFQGWRYLEPDQAPPDISEDPDSDDLPPHLVKELRDLGLL